MTYRLLIIISFLFYLTGCKNPAKESIKQTSLLTAEDSLKQRIFSKTFSNNSTAPDFVVFVVQDLNTNKSKEICCESDDLFEAFVEENVYSKKPLSMTDTYKKALEKWDEIMLTVSSRTVFSFKSSKSLEYTGYYNYLTDSLDSYSNDKTTAIIDSIKKNFFSGKRVLLKDYSKSRSIYLIHSLNKSGVFCGRDCESGYIEVRYVINKSGV